MASDPPETEQQTRAGLEALGFRLAKDGTPLLDRPSWAATTAALSAAAGDLISLYNILASAQEGTTLREAHDKFASAHVSAAMSRLQLLYAQHGLTEVEVRQKPLIAHAMGLVLHLGLVYEELFLQSRTLSHHVRPGRRSKKQVAAAALPAAPPSQPRHGPSPKLGLSGDEVAAHVDARLQAARDAGQTAPTVAEILQALVRERLSGSHSVQRVAREVAALDKSRRRSIARKRTDS